jgi:hypothetical protein
LLSSSTDEFPILDISSLTAGKFFVEVQVTDSTATNKPAAKRKMILTVLDAITLSASTDSDADGISDSDEGVGDSDGDGIPNRFDAQNDRADILPISSSNKTGFLAKVRSGGRLLLGKTAMASGSVVIGIDIANLASNGNNGQSTLNSAFPSDKTLTSKIFDYEIEGLDVPLDPDAEGNSVAIVLPLETALVADSTLSKYDAINGWKDFVEDANNTLSWAAFENGVSGNCPEASSTDYSTDVAQKAGKNCLKITLQDGGTNDADGVVDGRIVDPLGVGEASTSTATTATSSGGGGNVGWFSLLLLFGVGLARRLMFVKKER